MHATLFITPFFTGYGLRLIIYVIVGLALALSHAS